MKVQRKAPGTAATATEGKAKTTTSQPTDPRPFPQPWRRRKGGPSAQFGRKKHFIITHDFDGYWLVRHPGSVAIWLGEHPGPARALARGYAGSAPLLAEDAV